MPVTGFTTADIVLTERRRLELPLMALIWLGTASFSLAEGNLLYFFSCSLGVGVNWIVVRQHREIYVHRGIVNLGVLLSLIVILLEAFLVDVLPLITVGHFMMLIQLLKLFERKRSRDYVQLLTLNMLLMITAALITPSPWFAVALVAYLALACHVAMVFTLKRGLDRAGTTTLRGEAGPLSPRQVAWNVIRDWPDKALRRFVRLLIVPAVIGGALAFLLVPRTGDEMLHALEQSPLAGTFSTSIRLGRPKEIYLSDRIVMRVRATRPGRGNDFAVGQVCRYLRDAVLNTYEHSTWKNQEGNDRFLLSPSRLPPLEETLRAGLVHYDVRMLVLGPLDVVAPYPTVKVTGFSDQTLFLSRNLEYRLRSVSPSRESERYTTQSFVLPLRPSQRAYVQQIHGSRMPVSHIELPPDTARRIRVLAEEWCSDVLSQRRREPHRTDEWNRAIVRRLQNRLQAEYEYTLDLTASDPDRDGVEDFLFYMHKGHCEYFASALAVMCGLLDIPARLATGYVMDEYDPNTGEFLVRDRDAHAWCEVYFADTDWTIFDPTPGAARLAAMKRPWFSAITDFFQVLRFHWYRNVVGYDFHEQRELRDRASDQAWRAWGAMKEELLSLKKSFLKLLQQGVVDRILLQFLLLLQAITAAVALVFLLRRIRLRRRRRSSPAVRRRLRLLDRLLALLTRRGLEVLPEQTLQEQMRRAARKFALPMDRLHALTELQYRWRWGGQAPSPEEWQRASEHFDAVCELLSARRRS